MPGTYGRVALAVWPLAIASALPAYALSPDPPRPRPPVVFEVPTFTAPLPQPGIRSPLDTVTVSTFVKPPPGSETGRAAPLLPVTIGGSRPTYIVDLDSRFDAPLVRELLPQH
jgi:hypothetical protein